MYVARNPLDATSWLGGGAVGAHGWSREVPFAEKFGGHRGFRARRPPISQLLHASDQNTHRTAVMIGMSFFGPACTPPPTTLFVLSTAGHAPFFGPDEAIKRRHRRSVAAIMNDYAHQPRPIPPKKALLISDSNDVASIDRGEGLAGVLASQGFEIASLSGGAAPRIIAGLSRFDAKFTVSFDLSGWAGRELTDVCEAAGVAGLYSYKPATGMFKKVRGLGEMVNAPGYRSDIT